MKTKEWFNNLMEKFEDDFDFRLETIILNLTESVCIEMKDKNINRTQLSDLLDVSPAAITKILNGTNNFTLKTLLSIADALDMEFNPEFKKKKHARAGIITTPSLKNDDVTAQQEYNIIMVNFKNINTSAAGTNGAPFSAAG